MTDPYACHIHGNIYHQYTPVMLAFNLPYDWIRHGIVQDQDYLLLQIRANADGTVGLTKPYLLEEWWKPSLHPF